MSETAMRPATQDDGFTLIELLVVIIIIGILAAVAIPVFLNQRKNAVDASMKSDVRAIANQLESYASDAQIYPASIAGPVASPVIGGVPVRTSPGNVFSVTVDGVAGVYCIKATRASGVTPSGNANGWFYRSELGGLQNRSTSTC